jgi:hypothetical protein
MGQLRDLIDAGVFVFTGGRPRTKTKDSDPILQFKLTFRRIYGLTNFIGLAERDRFELSGADLEEWLTNVAAGKAILLRNLGGGIEEDNEEQVEEAVRPASSASAPPAASPAEAPTLFDRLDVTQATPVSETGPTLKERPIQHDVTVSPIEGNALGALRPTTLVLGLGFEDRTAKSVRELLRVLPSCKVIAVQYREAGKTKEILGALKGWGGDVETVPYESAVRQGLHLGKGPALVDVTGLAKPIIFHAVRTSLREAKAVFIAHTRAKKYYPTEGDMKALLAAEEKHNRQKFFEMLSGLLTGEAGPYVCVPLLEADADETRRNVLYAFASPKHERLLSLIEGRVIDRLEVVAPDGSSARNRVARQIANIAATDSANADVILIDSDALETTVKSLLRGFEKWYIQKGFNFEVGLTGSKMEAVAAATVSALCKVTQCWYVQPREFDPQRFTQGARDTRFFHIQSRRNSADQVA